MGWLINFYNEDVMSDIQSWPIGIKGKFIWIVDLIARHGIEEVGMPHIKAIGSGLFEIRAKGKEGIGRTIFCLLTRKRMIILHGFIKKTQKTPMKELQLATKRMKEVKVNEKKT